MYETCQELIRRQQHKLEKNYIELTPGMAVWVQHIQNTSWEPATVVSQGSSNSYWIMQENGTDQPRVYRRTRSMLKIRCTNIWQTRHNYSQLTESEKAKFQTPSTSNEARNYVKHNSVVFQDDLIKCKQNFDVIMDDTFIHSTAEEHMDDLMDLFKILRKYGLYLSPHKCQFFKKKIVYMGLEFQVHEDKVCYTPLKDKCDAIRNLESPKILRQTRAFCRMVNFLSSFLPNLRRLLIPINGLQKKAKKFKWMDEAKKAFNEIKKLLVSPPVLKATTPDGSFCLESDTSREGVSGTLLQKQGDEWVVIGYHSKRLPNQQRILE